MEPSKQYSRYAACFSSHQAVRLPEHPPRNHEIPPQDPEAKIPTGAAHETPCEGDDALQKYLDENLPRGKVCRSRTATVAAILCLSYNDGSLPLVVVYRALNRLAIPHKCPLPLISELLHKTRGGKWFTRLDLKNGLNIIRVAAGHDWKTAFRTKQGLFEYTVMLFGLTIALATF